MLCVHLNPQQDMDISNILATDKMTADRCLYLIIYIICGVRCSGAATPVWQVWQLPYLGV